MHVGGVSGEKEGGREEGRGEREALVEDEGGGEMGVAV